MNIYDMLEEKTVLECSRPGQSPDEFIVSKYTRDNLLLGLRAVRSLEKHEIIAALVGCQKQMALLLSHFREPAVEDTFGEIRMARHDLMLWFGHVMPEMLQHLHVEGALDKTAERMMQYTRDVKK